MPVAYGTETAAETTASPVPNSSNMTIFNGISDGIAKILIVLGVLMVFSFIILIVLSVLERSRAPRIIQDEEEEDEEYAQDFFEPQHVQHPAYRSAPDPEEISYTQRMLAMKDEERFEQPSRAQPITAAARAAVAGAGRTATRDADDRIPYGI